MCVRMTFSALSAFPTESFLAFLAFLTFLAFRAFRPFPQRNSSI